MKAKQSSHPADPAVEDRERGAVAREVAQRPPRERRGLRPQTHGPPDDYEALAAALAEALSNEADAFSLAGFCRGTASLCRCITSSQRRTSRRRRSA